MLSKSPIEEILANLKKMSESEKAKVLPKFFQAFPGGYGEGDMFLGIRVPNIRKIAKDFKDLDLLSIQNLIKNQYHEVRMCGLFILITQFEKAKNEEIKKNIVNIYLENLEYVNNWDLVDATAPKILGSFLLEKDKTILYELADSPNLWKKRIAIIATLHFIRKMQFEDTLNLAEILLFEKHDLIHKAVGWMLREVGNRHKSTEEKFLKSHYHKMPRTMLRYAIEKFPTDERRKYLDGTI